MQETSELWKSMFGKRGTRVEYKWLIAGTEYTEDEEESHSISPSLFSTFGIGNATICRLDLKIFAETVPAGAKIERFCRLVNADTGEESEWIPKGIFWAKHRHLDDDLWELEAYDAMRKADTEWTPDQALEFPMTMPYAVAVFCELMGVELDERTELNPTYTIDYPANGYTIRNELAYIAAAHGGNWIITFDGKLRLVPLKQESVIQHTVGDDLLDMRDAGQFAPVSKVVFMLDSTSCYEAGDATGMELAAECPFATERMATAVLGVVQGYVYQAYEAEGVNIDPAYELGDVIEVDGLTSIIVSVDDDGLGFPNISAPGLDEQQDDYPSGAGPMTQEFNRKIAETRSEITKTAEEIKLQVESTDGRISKIQQTVAGIKLEVSESTRADGKTYASITLTIGPNSYTGQILMEGNLNVSGQLSADALYAALGDIADLSVDKLSTSRRVALYLARDMSDDNYIRIHDEVIEFVSGVTDGSREQARNPSGLKIYWEDDPDGEDVVIASDGYPHKDGVRIFTTTAVTPWPVYVYSYTELVKSSQHFEMVGEHYLPVWTFGAGDQTGWNKAWMVKEAEAMRLMYRTGTGKDLGIKMNNDGHTDIYGLRRGSFLDFSELPFGKFYEMVEGLDKEYSYTVERDSLGRPVKIIDDEDGHALEVRWWQQ